MLLLHSYNPLNPWEDHTHYQVEDGLSPNQMIEQLGLVFQRPVVFMRDGKYISRRLWDTPIHNAKVCAIVELPGEIGAAAVLAIIAIILALAGLIYALTLDTPDADQSTASSIYSFNTGRNRLRIGEPFSESFGRGKIYPDLVQQSYVQNINNDQYLYFLGVIGVGKYDVQGVFIDNTPLLDYSDSLYNIILPGETPELVRDVVWTCNEVSSQEITSEWISYVISAPGTEAYFIEYDVTFSGGLVRYNKKGSVRTCSVTVQTEVCLVDARGEETSEWTTLENRTFSGSSKDPVRWSRKFPAPLGKGRYKIKIRRVGDHSTSARVMDKATFSGVRAYGAPHPDYSAIAKLPVTLLEAKIKASDQLKGDAGSQINVIATRILSHIGPDGFGPCVAPSRNISDAIAYMATSFNGGRQPDSNIDFKGLYALRNRWETFDHFFDYRFTSTTTVMEAAATACKCGLAVPYLPGGVFSAVRDELQDVPVCVFSTDNLTDLTISTKHRTPDSPTCLIMQYVDPDTWEDETVTCLDDEGDENNPLEISLAGCTSRQQAYEVGMQFYWQARRERTQVEFTTGMIGFLPRLFEKAIVQNPMIKWGQSGVVAAVEGPFIWLSEPVDFSGEESGAIYICLPDGSSGGPYTVFPTDDHHKVVGSIPGLSTLQADHIKATRYLFGPESVEPMSVRIMSISPQARDRVKIKGIVIDDSVYDDPGLAPGIGSSVGVPPLLSSISLGYTGEGSGHEFIVTWTGSAGKVKIELDEGSGFTTLEDNYTSHSKAFATSANDITIKVTPYDGDTLESGDEQTESYVFMAAPTGLTITPGSGGLTISWDSYADATSYSIVMYVDGDEVFDGSADPGTETIIFSLADLEAAGGPWTAFMIGVSATTESGVSPEARESVGVSTLSAPETIDFQERFANGVSISWSLVSEAVEYVVCYDDSAGGFSPSEGNVVYRGSQPTAIIGGLSMAGSYTHYFKVAALNGYPEDISSLNFAGPLTVTPATGDVSSHTVTGTGTFSGPSGGSSYTYQLSGTASGNGVTVTATLTGGGSGSAWCSGDGLGGSTTASLSAISSGTSNSCTVTISGGVFNGTLLITKII